MLTSRDHIRLYVVLLKILVYLKFIYLPIISNCARRTMASEGDFTAVELTMIRTTEAGNLLTAYHTALANGAYNPGALVGAKVKKDDLAFFITSLTCEEAATLLATLEQKEAEAKEMFADSPGREVVTKNFNWLFEPVRVAAREVANRKTPLLATTSVY